jgi:hypothetical protein
MNWFTKLCDGHPEILNILKKRIFWFSSFFIENKKLWLQEENKKGILKNNIYELLNRL